MYLCDPYVNTAERQKIIERITQEAMLLFCFVFVFF